MGLMDRKICTVGELAAFLVGLGLVVGFIIGYYINL